MIRSRIHLLGRPLHPLLITFPISLLGVVPIFDVLYFLRGDPFYFRAAYYDLLLGLVGAAIAGLVGLVDYGAIPSGSPARRAANPHLRSALGVAAFFFLSWLVRRSILSGWCRARGCRLYPRTTFRRSC
ncbi:MAG: DUF2231 domain-containing protein [Acidobacteria bacterium]|nr:DUF2231 domain-containing protein [Acidobacteriota bacterium]